MVWGYLQRYVSGKMEQCPEKEWPQSVAVSNHSGDSGENAWDKENVELALVQTGLC